jgi:hypothetical protein
MPGVLVMSVGSKQNECLAADIAAEALISANILVVAAAGNDAIDACEVHPASSKNSLTVGAVGLDDVTSRDVVWSKSNRGPCVSVYAPGQSITSAGITSPSAEKIMSGTSMAAPMIAGQSLLIMAAAPELSVSAVRAIIVSSGTRGTLDDSNLAQADVRIAHVPWKQMRVQSEVRGKSVDDTVTAKSEDAVTGFADDIVQFDLNATSQTNPPMQYIADYVAENITAHLTVAQSDKMPPTAQCSLSPDDGAKNDSTGSANSTNKIESVVGEDSPPVLFSRQQQQGEQAEPSGRMPLRMRCQIRCLEGQGQNVARQVDKGGGGSGAGWSLTSPDGAPIYISSRATVVQTGGDASATGVESTVSGKLSTTKWLLVGAGAVVGVLCVGLLVIVRNRRGTKARRSLLS